MTSRICTHAPRHTQHLVPGKLCGQNSQLLALLGSCQRCWESVDIKAKAHTPPQHLVSYVLTVQISVRARCTENLCRKKTAHACGE